MSRLDLLDDPHYRAFWTDRHLCTVTTTRADGTLHVTPMGIVLDPAGATAWGVTRRQSVKAANLRAGNREGRAVQVAVCQLAGPYWASLEGTGEILEDPGSIRHAEELYASRYRQPRPNPERVAVRISITRALGRAPEPGAVPATPPLR